LSIATRSFAPGRALLPCVVALLALAGFERNSALDGFGAATAAFVFVHLLADASDVVAPHAVALRPARAIGIVLFAATAAAIGVGITRLLPLAQGRLERALLATDLPAFDGGSGLADGDVRLGDVGELELHDDVVMRVFSSRAEKLRAHAYVRFDGRTWHASQARRVARRLDPRALDERLAARLEEPSGELYTLIRGLSTSEGELLVTRIVLAESRDGGLPAPAHARLLRIDTPLVEVDGAGLVSIGAGARVDVYSVAHARVPREAQTLEDDAREDALELPADLDPRLKQLARSIARDARSPDAKISRTIDAVRARARYALDPGAFHGRQPVAEFLFEKHRGWCEYFASATAVLLRLEGVPTRYVTGFDVHEDDRAGDHYVVRSADAHAWVEAWIDDERSGGRWVEIDPTPSAALDTRRRSNGALASIREWIAGAIARAELAPGRTLATVGGAFACALAVIVAARWFRRRGARSRAIVVAPPPPSAGELPSPAMRALAALETEFEAHGVPRPRGRTLREHFGVVAAELPDDARALAARRISLVYRAAYAGEDVDEAARPSADVSSRA
jgi:transglutaminase-like putative cysteine protease